MTNDDTIVIEQAVYGYSNGHRQLVSSFSLSPIDNYELASASDLAPGAKLSGDDSYLTGVMLPDSKRYALIRTWLAPEMPRPGCVWSHVLLLGRDVLSSLIDLTVLNDLLQRPADFERSQTFNTSIGLRRASKGRRVVNSDVVERLIESCYADVPIKSGEFDHQEFEHAILAVWSQQWPRLRSRFAFRSLSSTADLQDQSFRFLKGVSLRKPSSPEPWVQTATLDIVSGEITALRRFLWRYGKDIATRRDTFRELVEVFAASRDHVDLAIAEHVFARFETGEAETLKRDLLGLSNTKLSMVPSLNSEDLLAFIGQRNPRSLPINDRELVGLFTNASADHFANLVSSLYVSRDLPQEFFEPIREALVSSASSENLADGALPPEFVFDVLKERPELIEDELVEQLSTDQLYELIGMFPLEQTAEALSTILRRPFDNRGKDLIVEVPQTIFRSALELFIRSELHNSWAGPIRSWSDLLVNSLSEIDAGADLLSAARLLGFPVRPLDTLDLWYDAFVRVRSTLTYDDETRLLAYLFSYCVNQGIKETRRVVIGVLPELRVRILRGGLPNDVQQMLQRWLPWHDPGWDLNLRALKLFRQLYKRDRSFGDILDALHLNDEEYAFATDQDPKSLVREIMRAWTPPWFR